MACLRAVAWVALLILTAWIGLSNHASFAQSSGDVWADAHRQEALRLYQAGHVAEAAAEMRRALATAETALGTEHAEVAVILNDLAQIHQKLGEFVQAEQFYLRAVAIQEKVSPANESNLATFVYGLGLFYSSQGRLADAELSVKRALEMLEKILPEAHPTLGIAHINLGLILQGLGRYAEAEAAYRLALAINQRALSPDHPVVVTNMLYLAAAIWGDARLKEAEPLYERALAIRERTLPPEHPDIAQAMHVLGEIRHDQGRLDDAELLYRRALSIREKVLAAGHPDIAESINAIAIVYVTRDRLADAEPLLKQVLSMREITFAPDHPLIAHSLNNLASLYINQGRYSEAEPMLKRALAIKEKALPEGHPEIAQLLTNLGHFYQQQFRLREAEPFYTRALAILEKTLPNDHPEVARVLNNLALVYQVVDMLAEAEPLLERVLAIREKVLPAGHPDIAQSLNNLASLYQAQGRLDEAEQHYKRALVAFEQVRSADHPDIAATLTNLSLLSAARNEWPTALAQIRRSTDILSKRGRQRVAARASAGDPHKSMEFYLHVLAAHRAASNDDAMREESFRMAQLQDRSAASGALTQMAARQAKGDGELARLVRELQDLEAQVSGADARLSGALGRGDGAQVGEIRQQTGVLEARWREIDERLNRDFKEYAALAKPSPLDLVQTQQQLRGNEVLVVFLQIFGQKGFLPRSLAWLPIESFVWVVSKDQVRWIKLAADPRIIAEHTTALRCGLDQAAWEDDDGAARCAGLLKSASNVGSGKPLPFNLDRAHELYKTLFGQAEDLIKDKHLLIVPSGPLTALPFQVLVTEKPAATNSGRYAEVAWLAKRHAITVLPSVASLKSLRQFAKASKATQPFIGFGNPLLVGVSGADRSAWKRQSCTKAPEATRVAGRAVRTPMTRFFRGNVADVELIRRQQPLPETTDELCAVAKSLGAAESAIYLGDKANETVVKGLSEDGTLAQARVVHFATHGLLAGESEILGASKAEPALLLTPPSHPSEEDDGLLTASEIAQLKFDADWVLLSACNTAASGGETAGAEALSGLARAFFYAGARTLLVSHWAVDSAATVALVTKAFDEMKGDRRIGPAEALRRSMLALIDSGGRNAHPASWGPFVVVGEATR